MDLAYLNFHQPEIVLGPSRVMMLRATGLSGQTSQDVLERAWSDLPRESRAQAEGPSALIALIADLPEDASDDDIDAAIPRLRLAVAIGRAAELVGRDEVIRTLRASGDRTPAGQLALMQQLVERSGAAGADQMARARSRMDVDLAPRPEAVDAGLAARAAASGMDIETRRRAEQNVVRGVLPDCAVANTLPAFGLALDDPGISERARRSGMSVEERRRAEAAVREDGRPVLQRIATADLAERARLSGMTIEERRRAEANVARGRE